MICGPLPPISYKPDSMIGNTPTSKEYPLKVDIKTQTGDKDIETLLIYVTFFRIGRTEALLKFITILNGII